MSIVKRRKNEFAKRVPLWRKSHALTQTQSGLGEETGARKTSRTHAAAAALYGLDRRLFPRFPQAVFHLKRPLMRANRSSVLARCGVGVGDKRDCCSSSSPAADSVTLLHAS